MRVRIRLFTMIVMIVMMVGTFAVVPGIPNKAGEQIDDGSAMSPIVDAPNNVNQAIQKALAEAYSDYPSDLDLNDFLGDRDNSYRITYEPWKSKAAIHAIAYDEDTGFLALGGGYLYDNEVHLYRENVITGEFDKVFELGDGVIRGDVLSVDFGDTDLNSFLEVAVASSDGHVYVFEQRHLYDPYANTENMFDLVWTSPGLFRVFAVKIDDVDRDYRPDIIAGSWDGKVHLYEYDNHSGYPFVEEHWITYREVSTLDVGGKVYSLETGDTNNNGLPEIVVGTRDGRVYVFENAGTSIMINNEPFPLIRDNTYNLRWTSENYTWQPIRSIAVGELDGTLGDEVALVAEGQGVFTLDWDESRETYEYKKVQREFADWETYGFHGLDYWADSVVYAENVVYHDPANASLVIDEPIQYEWNDALKIFLPNASVYPYNTGMAQMTDGNYSTFDTTSPDIDNATAIVDFGLDEEGTGSANSQADIIITFKDILNASVYDKLKFYIGQTTNAMFQVNSSCFEIMQSDQTKLMIDVDDVLNEQKMDWFRYAKIFVDNDGYYAINSIELMQVYNLLTDALSLTIGPLKMDGTAYALGLDEANKIVVATVTGEFVAISFNVGTNEYEIVWESYDDERYTLGANVWDIEHIKTFETVPIWLDIGELNNIEPLIGNYNSWGYGIINPITAGGDGTPYYLIGTDVSSVFAVDMGGNADTTVNNYLNLIYTGLKKYTSAEVAWLWPTESVGQLPMIAVGSYNPDGNYKDPYNYYSRASIDFYKRSLPTEQFDYWMSIEQLDLSGQMSAILSMSKTTPKMSFADYDRDGDLDMVVSNGHVYMVRNIFAESGLTYFSFEPDYFEEINRQFSGIVWGQPEMVDINQDGLFDIVLSYVEKNGATCFINKGTATSPVWVEERQLFSNSNPETNLNVMGLTDIRLVPNIGGYTHQRYAESASINLQGNYSLAAYNGATGKLHWAIPQYSAIDSYLVATYPRVARMDFCLMHSESFRNLGFHVRESWNTDFDLEDWTLSISSGDIDGDGRGELIVGDYDNNVYAFEHMRNNTFKRMFRSFDLNHTMVTDVSPYAYEDLEGISGDFRRKIWDHAKFLIADIDLDQDLKKEIIVASDLQFYIFEATGIDDTIQYAYSFDLRNLSYLEQESNAWKDVTEITAVSAGVDLDNDGRLELVVAAGPFLFVYNIDKGSFEDMEQNDIFGMYGDEKGRYALFGNPEASSQYQNAVIQALAVGDTDTDGYLDLIIGGVEDNTLMTRNGLLRVYECMGGTFQEVWQAPTTVTDGNPVSSILIDDQDYDGLPEIIIGHTKGIDIFEWVAGKDSEYQLVETITSSPNYPTITANSITPSYSETYSNRTANDLVWDMTGLTDSAFVVYCDNSKLMWNFYNNSTQSWSFPFGVPTNFNYDGGSINIDYEHQPSLFSDSNGTYLVWKAKRSSSSRTDFWISQLNYTLSQWNSPSWVYNDTDTFGNRNFPDLFEYNSTHFGVLYVRSTILESVIYYTLIAKNFTGPRETFKLSYPDQSSFDVQKASIINLPDGGFAIAMSARKTDTTKADFDIWTLYSDSFDFSSSIPHRATSSFYDDLYPDIDFLWSDNSTLLVAYERGGTQFDDNLGLVASFNNGSTWTLEGMLNPYPSYFSRVEFSGYYYYQWSGSPTYSIKPMAFSPSIVGNKYGSGFMYAFGFTTIDGVTHTMSNDILYGINPSEDWIHNSLHDIAKLTVGDTDSDGRREIIAAFRNQFGVYELKSSTDGQGNMSYSEAFLSEPFVNEITGITTYDANGNGWQEIAISSMHGDVFVFEYMDPSHGPTEFTASALASNTTFYGGMLGGVMAESLKSGDVDNDGKDELVVNALAGGFHLFDDDGTLVWNVTSDDIFVTMDLIDIIGDEALEIVAIQWGEQNLLAYNSSDGSLLWNTTGFTNDLGSIDFGDIDGDGDAEIVVNTDDGRIWVIFGNGTVWSNISTGSSTIWGLVVGDFTNNTILDVAYANSSYAVRVIDPIAGTLFYETPSDMVGYSFGRQPMVAADFDNDGYDDVVFGNDVATRIANAMKKEIIYNSTVSSRLYGLEIDDFDGDSVNELLVFTKDGGMWLVEIGTLRTQWHYSANLGDFNQFVTGKFGGTGGMDIAIMANYSTIIAVDGKSGLPLWINFTVGNLLDMSSADFDDDGVDIVFAGRWMFGWLYSELLGFESAEIVGLKTETSYDLHKTYWDLDIQNINDTWSEDVDGDGFDEIFICTNSEYLSMWDSYHGSMVWNISLGGEINVVRFGLLDTGTGIDLGVLVDNDRIVLIDPETHGTIRTINAASNYYISDFLIAGFDTSPYDDIAVLYESATRMSSWVTWYESDGRWKYSSGSNATDGYSYIAMGYFTNDITCDIVYGGKDNIARVLDGDSGNLVWEYNLFTDIKGIVAGYFDSDNYEDFALETSAVVYVANSSGQNQMYSIVVGGSSLRGFYAADLTGDSTEELVLNVRYDGVKGYNATGNEVWQYQARLVYYDYSSWSICAFDDFNNDGKQDLILTNAQYINVVGGTTQTLMWNYVGDDEISGILAGDFDSNSGNPDIVAFDISSLFVISSDANPPALPPSSESPNSEQGGILLTASLVGIPLVSLVVILVPRVRKRKIVTYTI